MCQIVEGHNILYPRKSGGARVALFTNFQKKWGGQGPPGPLGSATPAFVSITHSSKPLCSCTHIFYTKFICQLKNMTLEKIYITLVDFQRQEEEKIFNILPSPFDPLVK